MTLEDGLTGPMLEELVSRVSSGAVLGEGKGLPIMRIPYPNASVQTPSRNPLPIECNSVDLAEMSLQSSQTLPGRNAPYLSRGVVAPRYDQITVDFKTAHAGLVAHEYIGACSRGDIPDTEGGVSGAGDGGVGVGHLEAADRRGVAAKCVHARTGSHVPHSNVSVATSANEYVVPRYHCPDTHDVPLQCSLMIASYVKDMDLCVIESYHNVFLGQMQACHHTLIRCDVPCCHMPALFPCRLN